MSAVRKPKQTWSIESSSDFTMFYGSVLSTEEHAFKFHSIKARQIVYPCQLKVTELYRQSIVT